MKVDVTIQNNQTITAAQDILFPSRVDVTVGIWNEQNQVNTATAPLDSEVVQFTDTNSVTVTFDVDPNAVTQDRVWLGYKIEAPITGGEFGDEAEFFFPVEEELGALYLFPIKFDGGKTNTTYIRKDDTYNSYFEGNLAQLALNAPEKTLVGGGNCNIVPTGSSWSQIPQLFAGFQYCLPPSATFMNTPLNPIPGIGHNRITTYINDAFRIPLALAENTNEFFSKVNAYPNLRLNVTLSPGANGTSFNGGIKFGDAMEIYVHEAKFLNKDEAVVTLRVERPTVNGQTLATINSFGDIPSEDMRMLWAWFLLNVEVEVQNPTTQEFSVYSPRINQSNYLFAIQAEVGAPESAEFDDA